MIGEIGGRHRAADLRVTATVRQQVAFAGGGLGAYGELPLYPDLAKVSVLLTNRPGLRDACALDRLDAVWLQAAGRA